MTKNFRETLKIILTLVALAVASALVLGALNKLTAVDEEAALRKKIGANYAHEVTERIAADGFVSNADAEIVAAFRAMDGAVIVLSASKKAYSGSGLQLLVIFAEGKIAKIVPYKSQETPGIGSAVLADAYLAAYIGFDTTEFDAVSRGSGGDFGVDFVSGATKTSNGVLIAVNNAIRFYVEVGK